ncbi:PREDICTED: uncharacterized protein LOC109583766 [Amphimedon queenslandica]|uniref:Uncharacterized protein n=1 Tax=Amphimedon queenslandica TaxID=400682 RepID=A0A1X7UEF3_AMPQE|nr:PREDICTED: uncharacterized protein LOC109583766 [Amphimedon queenslandica]|eukprot:XP_019854781.1 PREDICTED: uncharacterized protein LOC109583766 [Amphimedon queenslandica]
MGIRQFIRRYLCCGSDRSNRTQVSPVNEQEEARPRRETLDLAERNKDSSCPKAKQEDIIIEDITNVGHDQEDLTERNKDSSCPEAKQEDTTEDITNAGHDQEDEKSASISSIESVTDKQEDVSTETDTNDNMKPIPEFMTNMNGSKYWHLVEEATPENGITPLLTNTGEVYRNDKDDHAEIKFIDDNKDPFEITDLLIKNSPCHECSEKLLKHFEDLNNKPTIHVGRIWHLYDSDDDNGIIELLKDEFDIIVWEDLHSLICTKHPSLTSNYIKRLYKKANRSEPFSFY